MSLLRGPSRWNRLLQLIRGRPEQFSIALDYPIHPRPRYGYGKPLHPRLLEAIGARRAEYRELLESFLDYQSDIVRIERAAWKNDFLTARDAISLYGMIRLNQPHLYVEIGSGHSTRFARRAIEDGHLDTQIVSVDPHPRTELLKVADRVIAQPVEEMLLDPFHSLESGDILFVDHSHRVFTNSDSTVVFLDILPVLKPGVLVHFHDIFLPADYPPEWNERYYAEQYLLACHLLAHTQSFEIVLPNSFVSADPELCAIFQELWRNASLADLETHGCSFWVRIK